MKSKCRGFICFTSISRQKGFLLLPFFILCSFLSFGQSSYDTLFKEAKENLSQNNYSKSIWLFSECLRQASLLNDRYKAGNSLINLGICYDRSGDFENALTNYFKALDIFEKLDSIRKQAGILKNIGNAYRSVKTFNKAHEFFQLAKIQQEKIKDSSGLANVLNDLGLLSIDEQKDEEAIIYFTKVITIYKKKAPPQVIAFALNNLGIVYSRRNQFTKSYSYYNASLQAMLQLHDEYGKAMVYSNLGELLNKQNQPAQAVTFSLRGLQLAEKIRSKELLAATYQNLSVSYRALHDYKKSNQSLDELLALKDTIFKEESTKSYAEMETRYQNEKKQKEITVLKKDNAIKDLDITNQRRTRTFLLITLLLIILIAAIIYRDYAAKQKLNSALNTLNEKLNEANQSKTKLLSIISHDLRTPVSSLFNFLHLQKSLPGRLSAEQQEKYNNQINASAENVLNTMEDILTWSKSQMEKFEPVMENICLDDFLIEIINLNQTAANNKNISLIKDCPAHIRLETDPNFLKIALRNLVGNAVKFTPADGRIELSARRENTALIISVKDNGRGIPEDQIASIFNWNSIRSDSSGLGLRLAKEFTEKLNGVISVQSLEGEGTEFVLSLPMHFDKRI